VDHDFSDNSLVRSVVLVYTKSDIIIFLDKGSLFHKANEKVLVSISDDVCEYATNNYYIIDFIGRIVSTPSQPKQNGWGQKF
jgi:hypothetical protein